MNNVKFSIITVVYNDGASIEGTLRSILEQDYCDFECIVIDGGSKDNTLEIIKAYKSKFDALQKGFLYLSERDNGIYDAMNKGVNLSRGLWLNFLNAGDSFADAHVLSSLDTVLNNTSTDILYGKTLFIDSGFEYMQNPIDLKHIVNNMPFCHQSTFIKSELLKLHPYETKFRIISDYYFFLKMYLNNYKFYYYDKIIARHSMDGVSNTYQLLGHKEKMQVWRELDIDSSILLESIKFHLKSFAKSIVGLSNIAKIRKLKANSGK